MKKASDHRQLAPGTFSGLAFAILAIDLIAVGNGVVDVIFLTPFGLEAIAAMGLGDSVVLLFFAFFAGVVDVYASRLARAEGKGHTAHAMVRLLTSAVRVVACWSALACAVVLLLPLGFSTMGADATLRVYAEHYAAARLLGLALSLALSLASVSLRIFGYKKLSVWLVVIMFMANAGLNWVFLHGSAHVLFATPVLAVGVATIVAQAFAGLIGWLVLARHLRRIRSAEEKETGVGTEPSEFDYGASMFRTSSGVGMRQMNNYVAAVLPFLMISSLDVGVVAATTVATKLWTIYCRVPQAALGAAGIFLAYARGESTDRAHSSARRIFYPYVVAPSILAGVVILVLAPWLSRLFGGEEVRTDTVFLLFVAFMLGVPFYLAEQYSAEILTLEQEGTVMASMSTAVTCVVAAPIAVTGVLVWQSAFISLLSAAAASAVLAFGFTRRTMSMGYHYGVLRETTR